MSSENESLENIRQLLPLSEDLPEQVGAAGQRTGPEISNNYCPRLFRQLLYSPCKYNEFESKWEYLVATPYFPTTSKAIIRNNLVNPYLYSLSITLPILSSFKSSPSIPTPNQCSMAFSSKS